MALKIARRGNVPPFIVMDVMTAADARAAEGHAVYHLEVGQPSTPAPRAVIEAARQALDGDKLGYTLALGQMPLRQRIAQHYRAWYGVDLDPARVVVTIGSSGGFLLAFLAAANLMPKAAVRLPVRRFLEFCRTVPELVFALLFVVAFGLGPVPGVLAIAIHTMGALGKQFFEVLENIDMKPVEGVGSTGASWPVTVRFGALPQVAANFVSYALLRFEINVRGASIMGFVGAGGIGQDLIEAIRKFYYSDVSAILLLIVATVMLIDLGTERVRHRLLALEAAR